MTGNKKNNARYRESENRFWSTTWLFVQELGMLGIFAATLAALFMGPVIMSWLS